MKTVKIISVFIILLIGSTYAQTKWIFDKPHTKVGFSVTHLVITEIEGNFNEFDGSILANGESFEDAKFDLSIKTASINTQVGARDKHLRSEDFFNSEKYPEIKFKSKSFKKIQGKKYKLVGDLTIRDVTKEVELGVIHRGTVTGPMGKKRAGFKLNGAIDRFDFNLKWNEVVESGPIVDKTIKLIINVELIKS